MEAGFSQIQSQFLSNRDMQKLHIKILITSIALLTKGNRVTYTYSVMLLDHIFVFGWMVT